MTLFLGLFCLLLGIALFYWTRRRQGELGLPGGRVIYADTSRWGPVEEPLYDASLGLTGRPDYLVQQGDRLIPIEVKSTRAARGPYDAHIYQLAAYCLLVERVYGKRPAYGILHYPDRTYAIDFTPTLEADLLEILSSMRAMERRKRVARSHASAARCHGCGYRHTCDQVLQS